jgi:heat shock protein HslJ
MKRSSAALGVILLASCTASPEDPPRAALEGRDWRLVSLRGQDEEALARLPHAVTLRFEGGRVQGFGGCNTLAGSYGVEGDRVTLGTLAGTLMACAPAVMAVETALKEALAGTLRFEVAGDRLTLASGSDGEPGLAFEAAPPPRLEGVAWEVTGFNNGRQAVVSPRVGTRISLSFQDGSLVGHAGCNSFRASYTLEGERLSVGRAAATRKLCPEEGVMEQERELLAALESATTWTIDLRGMLDVHRADGERVLIAREAREPEAPS